MHCEQCGVACVGLCCIISRVVLACNMSSVDVCVIFLKAKTN